MTTDRARYYEITRLIIVPKIDALTGAAREWVEERAGIREHCGGASREVAEMEALVDFAYFRAGKERK